MSQKSEFQVCVTTSGSEEVTRLPRKYQNRVALFHRKVFTDHELIVGSEIILTNSLGQRVLCIAWRAKRLGEEKVALNDEIRHQLSVNSGDFVTFEEFKGPKVEASEIYLRSTNFPNYIVTPAFTSYIRQHADDLFYQEGSIMRIDFYGKLHELEVVKIVGGHDVKTNSSLSILETTGSEFENDLSDLTITKLEKSFASLHLVSQSELTSMDESYLTTRDALPERIEQLSLADKSKIQSGLFYTVTRNTKICVENEGSQTPVKQFQKPTLESIGGMSEKMEVIRQLLTTKLHFTDKMIIGGGILLHGPSGCGKTLIVKTIAEQLKCHLIVVQPSDVHCKAYSESESRLKKLFNEAKERAPSIIVFEGLEVICPNASKFQTDQDVRLKYALKEELDGIWEEDVSVIGITTAIHGVDPEFRKPRRFDQEIKIDYPNSNQREEDLVILLQNITNDDLRKEEISSLATDAHGFTGRDLLFVRKLVEIEIKYRIRDHEFESDHERNECVTSNTVLNFGDLKEAMKLVKPSALRGYSLHVPKVVWDDVAIDEKTRRTLKINVELAALQPERFTQHGGTPPVGVLLFGPPGCSKTLIARALATESGLNFIAVKGPELYSKYVGDTEMAVREVFEKARSCSPSIIFIDELDGLIAERKSEDMLERCQVETRVRATLLTKMNGGKAMRGVVVIAATNQPDKIDEALLRRFHEHVYIKLPDEATRRQIFNINLKKMPLADDVDLQELVERTEHFSGAEVVGLCNDATTAKIKEDILAFGSPKLGCVAMKHFRSALEIVKPNVCKELVRRNDEFNRKRNSC